jgi:hypothetical protein
MASETSKSRAKDAGNVDPNEVLQYLMSKNISTNHALGMLSNMYYESLFDPTAMGDKGASAGLFQHHASRKDGLLKATNGDLSNWKAQIDYALSEGASKKYLSRNFASPEEASHWFTYNWEAPSNKAEKAVQRQAWIKSFNNGQYSTGIYNPNNLNVQIKTVAPSKSTGKKATSQDIEGSSTETTNVVTPDMQIPTAYISPELLGNVGYGPPQQASINPDEFVAAVEKEDEKETEKQAKVKESEARSQIEQKTQEEIQQENQNAFLEMIQAATDNSAIQSGNKQQDTTAAQRMAQAYQFEEIPVQQGMPELPTIYQFEKGGEMEDEEEEEDVEEMDEEENNEEEENEKEEVENEEEDEDKEDEEGEEDEEEGEEEDEVEYLTPEEIEELISKGYKIQYVKK